MKDLGSLETTRNQDDEADLMQTVPYGKQDMTIDTSLDSSKLGGSNQLIPMQIITPGTLEKLKSGYSLQAANNKGAVEDKDILWQENASYPSFGNRRRSS